jgi:hypothetical protein
MQCKHQNGTWIDYTLIGSEHDVMEGYCDPIGWHSTGNIVGHGYKCSGCGRIWKFKGKPRQKWLQAIYKQL